MAHTYDHVFLHDWATPREARQSLGQFIHTDNERRLHQSLGYRPPAEVYFAKTATEPADSSALAGRCRGVSLPRCSKPLRASIYSGLGGAWMWRGADRLSAPAQASLANAPPALVRCVATPNGGDRGMAGSLSVMPIVATSSPGRLSRSRSGWFVVSSASSSSNESSSGGSGRWSEGIGILTVHRTQSNLVPITQHLSSATPSLMRRSGRLHLEQADAVLRSSLRYLLGQRSLEAVEMGGQHLLLVLQASGDDAGGDAKRGGKALDFAGTERPTAPLEIGPQRVGRDEEVGCA